MSTQKVIITNLSLFLILGLCSTATAQRESRIPDQDEMNNQIRREKFDLVLPEVMRKNNVDMWIHVMRIAIPDEFGAEELGSTSGVFVFTDRGDGRIERAILGRRWGASQRERRGQSNLIEESGAYDFIADPVRVQEPVGSPVSEYDYRFKGLKEFVVERAPKRIAVNFKHDLGPWVTTTRAEDGLSYTDYLLLTEELGPEYSKRLVSSEYVMMDYIIRKVPIELKLIKKICKEDVERIRKEMDEIVPGVTRIRDTSLTVFHRMSTGLSQRGRSAGWEGSVVQGGDILCSPERGVHAYVLREGETEPPPEIQKLYDEYLKVEKILAETIRAGLTPREIARNYTKRFEEEGIIIRGNQLHMIDAKNNWPIYAAGYDPEKTHLTIDSHGMMKGARNGREFENYFGPRIGSLGPDWSKDITLPPNHHFVLEYFFYMPSPANAEKDQYLLWWNHEEAITTESGVKYLSPPQKELYLIH